jgi:hypothetical protein
MSELPFIGLHVRARLASAGVLDAPIGEARSCSALARTAERLTWPQAQGKSLSVVFEAAPSLRSGARLRGGQDPLPDDRSDRTP